MDELRLSPATKAAKGGDAIDVATGAVVPPIHIATTYARNPDYELPGPYVYSRYDTPAYLPVEQLAADLDGGADALVFSSGMAAINAVLDNIGSGEHIVAPDVMYHGAQDLLRSLAGKRDVGLTLFDAANPAGLDAAVTSTTSLVWIETPVNPTWDVIDIAAAARSAHRVGARLAVDSTVAPPVTTRPIDHGADLVFHSATKYYNGHSDVSGGILVTAALDPEWDRIRSSRAMAGAVLGPVEAWLLLRGARTLFLRFERASTNAMAIASHLEGHPRVTRVLYPGLESHPGHEVAARQMTGGFGGMVSLLIDGDERYTRAVVGRLQVFVRATSLGGVESLAEHRKTVEGPHSVVPENLVRLSVGIEDVADLTRDLDQALAI